VHASELEAAADAATVLMDAACSASGTRVYVSPDLECQSCPPVGVLLLGFAGSAAPSAANPGASSVLGPYVREYEQTYKWRVVCTAASGLTTEPGRGADAADVQLDRLVQGVAGCRKLLVHVMSNSGQALWASLLHRKALAIRSRVAAVVYDCACSRMLQHEGSDDPTSAVYEPIVTASAHVITSTVLMPAITMQLAVNDPQGVRRTMRDGDALSAPVRLAARHLAERYAKDGRYSPARRPMLMFMSLLALHAPTRRRVARAGRYSEYIWINRPPRWASSRGAAWTADPSLGHVPLAASAAAEAADPPTQWAFDAAQCPAVPTLVLTSESDTVILPSDCSAWCDELRRVQPHRSVRLVSLQGTHCMLLQVTALRPVSISRLATPRHRRHACTTTSRHTTIPLRPSTPLGIRASVACCCCCCCCCCDVMRRDVMWQHQKESYVSALHTLISEAQLDDTLAPIQCALPATNVADGSNGADAPVADAAMTALLTEAGLAQLSATSRVASLSLDAACALYRSHGRAALLGKAKELGVLGLGERQKLAGAVGKHVKAMDAPVALS
jgi:hypothetical protein